MRQHKIFWVIGVAVLAAAVWWAITENRKSDPSASNGAGPDSTSVNNLPPISGEDFA